MTRFKIAEFIQDDDENALLVKSNLQEIVDNWDKWNEQYKRIEVHSDYCGKIIKVEIYGHRHPKIEISKAAESLIKSISYNLCEDDDCSESIVQLVEELKNNPPKEKK